MKHIPQLDGLRAIAVLLVLFHHYFYQSIATKLHLGSFGVDLFFVLSGFLISRILLSYREKYDLANALKLFYVRRIFRIFPLYYFYLFLITVLFFSVLSKPALLASGFFISNLYAINNPVEMHQIFGHFWSLAVEEQFYFVWPLLLLLTPKRYLASFMAASIIGSILFSAYYTLSTDDRLTPWLHTFSCVQSLAMGGLLALLMNNLAFLRRNNTLFLALSFLLMVAGICINNLIGYFTLLRFSGSMFASLLIVRLMENRKEIFTTLMLSKPAQFIGKISFGIYVYHNLVPFVLDPYVRPLGIPFTPLLTTVAYSLLTIGISYLSFRLIENPINSQKDRFRVEKKQKQIKELEATG